MSPTKAVSRPFPPSPHSEPQAGDVMRLGRYTLKALIGKGGMADVFLATQDGPMGFSKTCVVKRIRKSLSGERRFVEMFLREARVAARLNHPNAVQIFELGQDGKEYFLAMEFLDGVSLSKAARRSWHHDQSVPMEVAIRAAADAALGLHHAHTLVGADGKLSPLIHRDVSPDNIMLTRDGVSKVLDFGIAKSTDIGEVTGTGEVKGKIPFMSPEQLQGQPLDGRSDLWSLGVTMYWILTGRRPFDSTNEPMTIDGILRRDPKRLRELNPFVPIALEELVLKLLEKDREKRVASGAELAQQLVALLGPAAGYSPAGAFAGKVMAWEDAEPGQPISSLSLLAARPESQWLKRLSEAGDGIVLAPVHPVDSTPSGGRPRIPSAVLPSEVPAPKAPAPDAPSTGGTVTGLAREVVGRPRFVPIAAGIAAAVTLVVVIAVAQRSDDTPIMIATDAGAAPASTDAGIVNAPVVTPVIAPVIAPVVAPVTPTPEKKALPADTRISVRTIGPGGVAWKAGSKHLGNGNGSLRAPKGTTTLTAVDNETGGVTTVRIVDGVADYNAVGTGTLLVRVKPWAIVQIGKKRLGTTPIDPLTLKAGRYSVLLVRDTVTKTVSVDVKAGGTATAQADLRE